ncbi:MAG: hypothetical protein WBM07_01895, partial [Chitinivibrionales bacterium]
MIEMHAAKEIKGTVVAPPSSDLFFLSLSMALVTGCATRVSPFRPTPRTLGWIEAFNTEAAITVEQDSCFISPGEAGGAHQALRLPYADIPYRDFIVFMLLGHCNALIIDRLPPQRFQHWVKVASRAG